MDLLHILQLQGDYPWIRDHAYCRNSLLVRRYSRGCCTELMFIVCVQQGFGPDAPYSYRTLKSVRSVNMTSTRHPESHTRSRPATHTEGIEPDGCLPN